MTRTKLQLAEQAEAIARLQEWIKPGDTIYCILRHVSTSGMTRVIDCFMIEDNRISNIGYNASLALDYPWDDKRGGMRVGGCGMDMGFSIVYNLSCVLHGDSLNIDKSEEGRSIISTSTKYKHGYSLKHCWL